MQIQWYPGHMAKTKRIITESISQVDIVMELLDARIPASSRNPDIDILAGSKKRIILLNKSDLADPKINKLWKAHFEAGGIPTVMMNSTDGRNIDEVINISRGLMSEKIERMRSKGRISTPIRVMIAGIPNVGKSTFINRLVGRAATATGDRPGVTRAKQWVRIYKDFELLDTPGILWPKFDDIKVGLKLAFTGAIKDDTLDMVSVAYEFVDILQKIKPDALNGRYKINTENATAPESLELLAHARGFLRRGGEPDIERAAIVLLDEYRASKLGRISLERP